MLVWDGADAEVDASSQVEGWFISTSMRIYFLIFLSNMVVGYVVMFVLFMIFWFRLVNKVGIVICTGLTKASEAKVIPEGSPDLLALYNIFKHSWKAGAIIIFVLSG